MLQLLGGGTGFSAEAHVPNKTILDAHCMENKSCFDILELEHELAAL